MIGKLVIGPSTGWFFAAGINSIVQQKRILEEIPGVNAVEVPLLSLAADDKRLVELTEGGIYRGDKLHYISLHIVDYLKYGGVNPDIQIRLLKRIIHRHNAQVVPIHPEKEDGNYPRGYYRELMRAGIPLAFENMDRDKADGWDKDELSGLILDLEAGGIIFDVQHAFEHDFSMNYARDLFMFFMSLIRHFHVSGENGQNRHALLHKSENAEAIIEFLGWALNIKQAPLILEGQYSVNHPGASIAREVKFLTKELCG